MERLIAGVGCALALLLAPVVSSACDCGGVAKTTPKKNAKGWLVGTPGADCIEGTPGADVIVGKGGDDVLCGGGGADIIRGGPGADRIFGGPGEDVLEGNAGDDILDGGDGHDVLRGGKGNDTLKGGAGHDFLDVSNGGQSRIEGGPGLNRIRVRKGDHTLACGGTSLLFGGGAKALAAKARACSPQVVADGAVAVQRQLAAVAPSGPAPCAKPSTYAVELTGYSNKIYAIKAVRVVLSLGLKEAKALVDRAPVIISEGVDQATAQRQKTQLEAGTGQVKLIERGGCGTPTPQPPPAQTEFAVELRSYGARKIAVIKVVRSATGLGLKEAKNLVESAPVVVKEGLDRAAADALKRDLEAQGAEAVVR